MWEAVVNLTAYHTMEDMEKLARYFKKEYGWQTLQIAIHRDEGHIDMLTGKKIYNFHAHFALFMLDASTGIYLFKKRDFSLKAMSKLQTDVSNLIGMPRDESKLKTKKERLTPAQYRQVMKEKEELELEIKRLDAEVEMFEELALKEHEEKLELLKDTKHLSGLIQQLETMLNELEKQVQEIQIADKVQSRK